MRDYIILSDSTSDMSRELREEYGIDYMKMGFSAGGRDYAASLDWEEISPEDFYVSMEKGVSYKTAQVSVQSFTEKFRQYLEKGMDILYIGCSSALSGSVKTAELVREQLRPEFPEASIYSFDSLISGMGQGLMTMKAAELKRAGTDIDGVHAWLEAHRMKFNQLGSTGSLEYLKKAGRVKASKAFFGDLFAVKPLIISDTIGQNLAISKAKGRKNSLQATADYVAAHIDEPEKQTIYIGHANCEGDAAALRDMLREKLGGVRVELNVIGPIVGASVGPGTFIAYYYGADKASQMPDA